MISAWTPLANITLASGQSTITFTSISGSYRDLVLVMNGTLTSADGISFRFNGDSGANYYEVSAYMRAQGTYTSGNGNGTGIFGDYYTNGYRFNKHLHILDYSQTSKQKSMLYRESAPSTTGTDTTPVGMLAGRWANTAAITSITCITGSTMVAGTTATLYGISA